MQLLSTLQSIEFTLRNFLKGAPLGALERHAARNINPRHCNLIDEGPFVEVISTPIAQGERSLRVGLQVSERSTTAVSAVFQVFDAEGIAFVAERHRPIARLDLDLLDPAVLERV